MKSQFFLIQSEYVGPNQKNSRGNWIGDSRVMTITTQPGKTNFSHEERTDGWLGTTNDNSLTAFGVFDTIEEARATASEMGFTEQDTNDDDDSNWATRNDGDLEFWITPEAEKAQWDAGDWFINGLGKRGTCAEYGITAKTTDAELDAAVDTAENEDCASDVVLHGTLELFTELRNELRDEQIEKLQDERDDIDADDADTLAKFDSSENGLLLTTLVAAKN